MRRVAVIGGSGLYSLEGLEVVGEHVIDTPFGATSDAIIEGRLGEATVFFLPRHGRGHSLLPSEIPYRANVWALKTLGVDFVVTVTAVGSLREHIHPGGNVVLVDQFIDRTKHRKDTFFGGGVVGHVSLADPICAVTREILAPAAAQAGATVHNGGTYVCIEGPAFSPRAESHWFRSMGADVVGMTAMPEARLAREAGLSYAVIALPTDYDSWSDAHDAVTVEQVVETLRANVALAKQILEIALPRLAAYAGEPPYGNETRKALFMPVEQIPADRMAVFGPLLGTA